MERVGEKMSMRTRRIIVDVILYVILSVLAIIWILPIVWLVLQSFSAEYGGEGSSLIPTNWGIYSYVELLSNRVFKGYFPGQNGELIPLWDVSQYNYVQWFLNTLLVAVITTIISTLLVLFTSYAFSRLRFKSRKTMMKTIMVLGMFPGFLSMIILYQILDLVGLTYSLFGLILCYVGGAGMGYYVCKGFFDTVSKSIDEAAMLDGANKLQIFYKITLPLAKPIIVYTVITSFMGPWCDYILSSYLLGGSILTEQSGWTIAIGLYDMLMGQSTNVMYYTQFCAGAVLIAIPISILFIFVQKYYVSGITGGSVK
ncbi:MAG: sugar ABC transporter permease [Bacillales bacterium]|jgi:arabinogalactan oligomer/maltooligosaccharide transport system permease protein|nr:sugar ABC transporter permease [Bacillales bacterium]